MQYCSEKTKDTYYKKLKVEGERLRDTAAAMFTTKERMPGISKHK